MQIFLSYAAERREISDRIALRLRDADHEVFFDRDDLPAGEGFDKLIRERMQDSDLLVFLVSPESVAPGAYTHTELSLARQRWRRPSGHVLPVMVADTPYEDIPEYLKAVSVLEPSGDVAAETVAAVEAMNRGLPKWAVPAVIAAVLLAAAVAFGLFGSGSLQGTWSVTGVLSDEATNNAVAGVAVEVRRDAEVLTEGRSDPEGRFSLTFQPGRGSSLKLFFSHDDYVERSLDVNEDGASFDERLYPQALAGCKIQNAHGVVVGHFSPPLTGAAASQGLSGRIADVLYDDIVPDVQKLNLVAPHVIPCEGTGSVARSHSGGYARALGADAFVTGSVDAADGGFDVKALVGDPFELFDPPLSSVNRRVALGSSDAGRFSPEMRAAILTALARGYAERESYAECVEVTVVAQRLLGRLTDEMEVTRRFCQQESGVLELAGGETQ